MSLQYPTLFKSSKQISVFSILQIIFEIRIV